MDGIGTKRDIKREPESDADENDDAENDGSASLPKRQCLDATPGASEFQVKHEDELVSAVTIAVKKPTMTIKKPGILRRPNILKSSASKSNKDSSPTTSWASQSVSCGQRTSGTNTKSDNQEKWACQKCDITFGKKDLWERHLLWSHGEDFSAFISPVFSCSDCSKIYISFTNAVKHIEEVHPDSLHLQCNICNANFPSTTDMLHHKISTHLVNYRCIEECGNRHFFSINEIVEHLQKTPHKEKRISKLCQSVAKEQEDRVVETFVCHQCFLIFTSQYRRHFFEHRKTHEGPPRNHVCKHCGFSTFSFGILSNHSDKIHPDSQQPRLVLDANYREFHPMIFVQEERLKRDESVEGKLEVALSELDLPPGEGKRALVFVDRKNKEACFVCQQALITPEDVNAHYLLHFTPCNKKRVTEIVANQDKKCEMIFTHGQPYYSKLTMHNFQQQNEVYECKVCCLSTKKPYLACFEQCPDCTFFGSKSELFVHQMQQTVLKKCFCCNFMTASSPEMLEHIKGHLHIKSRTRKDTCLHCMKRVPREDKSQHLKHCTLAILVRLARLDKTDPKINRFLAMCKYLIPEICEICGAKLHSKNDKEMHISSHHEYQCPVCVCFVKSLKDHLESSHPNYVSDQMNIDKIDDSIQRMSQEVAENAKLQEELASLSMFSDIRAMQVFTYKNFCSLCRHGISPEGRKPHFLLHLTPCCSQCDLTQNSMCFQHDRPLFLHENSNYWDRFSQHRFQDTEFTLTCSKCNFVLSDPAAIVIAKNIIECSKCNFSTFRSSTQEFVVHAMRHLSIVVCRVKGCADRAQPHLDFPTHLETVHEPPRKCDGCDLEFVGRKILAEHFKVCKPALAKHLGRLRSLGSTPEQRLKHMLQIKTLKCDICQIYFDSATEKAEHRAQHPLFECPICREHCPADKFENHLSKEHSRFLQTAVELLADKSYGDDLCASLQTFLNCWVQIKKLSKVRKSKK
ncbi:uncharacterized protein LOC132201803 [Neocloeon triangulifer]|uniref:uncharacterized protein LOC132201803 n=1 Tax=Neocloeon triangulifer TaxID=2078957 RepID=UPI00286F78CE|nr:uncharacterized protein LOC132201803 [Neocloeon triangulifer]XP_059484273.1 uncharacterized protein LOC132201803 [Neocloeon triangulifer]